jgi:hypothetical protein
MRYATLAVIAFILGLGFLVLNSYDANAGMAMPCNIVIEKVEVPDTGQEFEFNVTGDINEVFFLQDGESNNIGMDIDDVITIAEDIPEGYSLEIECTPGVTNCGSEIFVPCLNITPLDDGNGVIVECIDNDTGSCTFTNTLNASPAEVPTLSEWGLIAMAGVLGLIAFFVIRRKKALA